MVSEGTVDNKLAQQDNLLPLVEKMNQYQELIKSLQDQDSDFLIDRAHVQVGRAKKFKEQVNKEVDKLVTKTKKLRAKFEEKIGGIGNLTGVLLGNLDDYLKDLEP